MNWNDHSKLKDQHAILSPSSAVTWMNYSKEDIGNKLLTKYYASLRTPMGTALHDFAATNISLREKISTKSPKSLIHMIRLFLKAKEYPESLINFASMLPEQVYQTLVLYINDCIGFRMDPEVILQYTENCFGTTDAINFNPDTRMLRISDLKTGDTPGHMEQLLAYAALFCLEYHFKPGEIKVETRLYQYGDVTEMVDIPPSAIVPFMDQIVLSDKYLTSIKQGGN